MLMKCALAGILLFLGGAVHAQSSASSSKMTLTIAGKQRFSLTTPSQLADGFVVKAVDTKGNPIHGLSVSFFPNASYCLPLDPNCKSLPGGYYGDFSGGTPDGSGSINVLTDVNGVAVANGFVGGTVSGLYTFEALIDPLVSATNKSYVDAIGLSVKFDIEQSFPSEPIFGIQSGISGSWFNPETSGQGFNFEVLGSNLMVVYFYTFDGKGNNVWLVGTGNLQAGDAGVELVATSGGFFPPNFDPTKISHSDWGKLKLHFSDCNNGTAQWTVPPTNAAFQNGSFSIQRITSIPGLLCQ